MLDRERTHAVVLAAGRGSRLGSYTRVRPKCLVQVGARPLLESALHALAGAAISRAVVVTGYLAEQVARTGERVGGMPVRYVHNPAWGRTGTSASLLAALRAIAPEEHLLVIEGDVVFAPALLEQALDSRAEVTTLVSELTPGLDGSIVALDPQDRILRWTHPDGDHIGGRVAKTANITAVSAGFATTTMRPVLENLVQVSAGRAPVESAMDAAIQRRPGVARAAFVPSSAWCEVDDERDLARARGLFGASRCAESSAPSH